MYNLVVYNTLSGKQPYRLKLLELLPTDGWEHPRQPIKDLCLLPLYAQQ